MPADRRATFPTAKPVKTERTHEENQERAYIAASRRSDRSLEARIESARRASEIHKKRTGRALRVTEQDVVNEEMYEEEDDDLPTQYQRLNAHLQTSSWLFNRKLHDYIATQHGVRNMFLNQQFPGHQLQPYGSQYQPNATQLPMMSGSMLPPQAFNAATPDFTQPQQPFSPQGFQHQQQGYRHAPYSIPQRPQPHQRSASIATPHVVTDFAPVNQPGSHVTTPRGEFNRRLSLPQHALETSAQQTPDGQARPPLSRSSTAQSLQHQSVSPQRAPAGTPSTSSSGHATPQLKSEHTSPISYQFGALPFGSSQVLDMNPLSMSLPPESQQFVGSALDPSDPRTSLFMAGSENLPQPFTGTYTYNPNLSPKSSRALVSQPGIAQTLAPEQSIKLDAMADSTSTTPPSALSDHLYTPQPLFTPTGFEYSNFFDSYSSQDGSRRANDTLLGEPFEDNSFVNWDQ
ncbi:uncharacterized protein N0V89_009705 [Didymosphaeria variabile]|uniref:Uncharacterized protein n=1 Tax=Didymosphaeria variabile TaxID=1932322 RepID=A0A9W8XDV2_9PLEO|nr:uncharacterized protein N0V89_009705 [Didymosphaeria variabile]KAJ4348331.1 hypothetical protein N0V89_009705 [Didymosphaeria variabile]